MADPKKPFNLADFAGEAVAELFDGVGDVLDGSIFDFAESTKEKVKEDGDGNGSGSGVPAIQPVVKPGSKSKPPKSAADKLRDAFTSTEKTGEAAGVEGTPTGETGTDAPAESKK